MVVYKIPYRRARAWPSGCIGRVRRASKGILHTMYMVVYKIPYLLSSRARLAECAREQRYLAYNVYGIEMKIQFLVSLNFLFP